jgi:hypothetical protein
MRETEEQSEQGEIAPNKLNNDVSLRFLINQLNNGKTIV